MIVWRNLEWRVFKTWTVIFLSCENCIFFNLRYYPTLKLRKLELLFYKTNTCLQKATTCAELQAEQIFSAEVQHIFFHFWAWFYSSFYMLFPEAPASCGKKNEIIFAAFYFYLWAQKVCLMFLISYFKLEILIFLSFMLSFLLDLFSWKAPFL